MKNSSAGLTAKLLQTDPADICISSVTVAELEYGCAKSKWSDRSRQVMNMFVAAFSVISFDQNDAVAAGRLRAELAEKGKLIGPYDIQIAAQGIARGLTVVTHNTAEFSRIRGISLEDWVAD